MSVPLACLYVVNLNPLYLQMALTSVASLRAFDANVQVIVKVADDPKRGENDRMLRCLSKLVDTVEYIPPAPGDYFPANKTVLSDIDANRIVFVDADTIFFGSIGNLNRRFASFDVAACPSTWVWRSGYKRSFAPDIYIPLNSGLVVMSRSFAATWGRVNATRPSELLIDPARGALMTWLRSVNKDAWPRGDFTFSELAWNGKWTVGLFSEQDCHLLSHAPHREDPAIWLSATVLHTYSHLWSACVERLKSVGWVDPAYPPVHCST